MLRRLRSACLRACLSLLLMLTLPLQALAAVAPVWLPHGHAGLMAADGSVPAHRHALHAHAHGLGVHALTDGASASASASASELHGPDCTGHRHAAHEAAAGADDGDCGAHWFVSAAMPTVAGALRLPPSRPVRHAGLVALHPLRLVDPPARPPRA